MISLGVLYTTAALLALVATSCTALCLAWTIPAWRRRLALRGVTSEAPHKMAGGLSGWPARVGSALISAGIGACALIGWYGSYCALAAL